MAKSPFPDRWTCGHPRTAENTAGNGRYGQCRTCKIAYLRRRRPQRPAEDDAPVSADVALYRTEKAIRAERLAQSAAMQAAKAAYAAQQERDRQARKGGRPKGSGARSLELIPAKRNQFANVTADPADALLNALGGYQG